MVGALLLVSKRSYSLLNDRDGHHVHIRKQLRSDGKAGHVIHVKLCHRLYDGRRYADGDYIFLENSLLS